MLLDVIGCIVEPGHGRMRLDGEVVFENRWLRTGPGQLRLEMADFIFQFHNSATGLDESTVITHQGVIRI